ncbi:MAG: hypothetical protein ACOC1X_00305 [Promethearchaeota archaeon]
MDKDFDKIREWVENNIFPNDYQTRDEFESDIDRRIEGYSEHLDPPLREAIWSDYQDLVEHVENVEQELENVSEEIAEEPSTAEEKEGLASRISRRLKAAIDRLLGVFKR